MNSLCFFCKMIIILSTKMCIANVSFRKNIDIDIQLIYIYIYIYIYGGGSISLVKETLIKYYQHPLSAYFHFNPFKSSYSCFNIWIKLVNNFPDLIISKVFSCLSRAIIMGVYSKNTKQCFIHIVFFNSVHGNSRLSHLSTLALVSESILLSLGRLYLMQRTSRICSPCLLFCRSNMVVFSPRIFRDSVVGRKCFFRCCAAELVSEKCMVSRFNLNAEFF